MAAIPSEFEERAFEAPLYNQLEAGTRLVWCPGQVFEQYVGFDRALFLNDPLLWPIFGFRKPLRGALLNRYDWDFILRRRRRGEFPNFKLNLFIQAKRSHYYRRRPRQLAKLWSPRPCWRFDIQTDQQEALAKIVERVGNRAIAVYAAPVFHRWLELNGHTSRGSILSHCTFPLVKQLSGHSAWYYSEPGGSGIANPDPTPIEGQLLESMLRGAISNTDSPSNETPSSQLEALSNLLFRAIAEDIPDENPRKAIFFERVRQIRPLLEEFDNLPESTYHFLQINAFAEAFSLDWYVVGKIG